LITNVKNCILNSTIFRITNYDSKPIDPIIEKPAIIEAPIAEEKPLEESSEIKLETSDKIEKLDTPPRATGASVFDDLENMFDEFSKELDSFLT